jgi:ABC-type antimicrobial peptide transport system permease subunit
MLVAVGIHGLITFSVTQRTQEIGIRMPVGALPRTILTNTLAEGVKLASIGIAIGIVPTVLCCQITGPRAAGRWRGRGTDLRRRFDHVGWSNSTR